jgi:HD-GYP domain-containing protein (c-di-GMP phosphodiesterase class II)
MTSDRSYRDSIGHDAASAELERHVGTQFDAHVVQTFLEVLRREATEAEATLRAEGRAAPTRGALA